MLQMLRIRRRFEATHPDVSSRKLLVVRTVLRSGSECGIAHKRLESAWGK
jgi:hypothetical protein